MKQIQREWITREQAAARLGISTRQLDYLRAEQKIGPILKIGRRQIRLSVEALNEFVQSHLEPPPDHTKGGPGRPRKPGRPGGKK